MRDQVEAAGARGLIVGMNGGLDSAVVSCLCQLALPGAVVGALLPCQSDPDDEAHARLVAAHVKLPTVTISLDDVYDPLAHALRAAAAEVPRNLVRSEPPPEDVRSRIPLSNVKPRLRMTALYFLANRLGCLVAGAANRSELSIGYLTKYGDSLGDLLPIGNLLKGQVRMLARDLGVPAVIVNKPPSTGLWLGQTDEAEIGFGYADLEAYLTKGPEAVAPALALRIERLIRAGEHKRALVPAFEEV